MADGLSPHLLINRENATLSNAPGFRPIGVAVPRLHLSCTHGTMQLLRRLHASRAGTVYQRAVSLYACSPRECGYYVAIDFHEALTLGKDHSFSNFISS